MLSFLIKYSKSILTMKQSSQWNPICHGSFYFMICFNIAFELFEFFWVFWQEKVSAIFIYSIMGTQFLKILVPKEKCVFLIVFWKYWKASYTMLCAIWYHFYNLQKLKNSHGRVLLLGKFSSLVKLSLV